ncbi:SCO2523 family variant P-loop protein [Streptomyces sp. NPDC006140]|uniref:SCO2523 family variant P-loop protein n=1 Tax=Streptomyces sp. NPDC006140 TaxID=3154579 RepID=UPI0033C7CA9F
MLVIAASDKGGTGRSVTSANLAYQRALRGDDVCYVDFDFGSATSAAVFDVPEAAHGVAEGGLHTYLEGGSGEPLRLDVWQRTEHPVLLGRPHGSGRLVLLPGDVHGGEFATDEENLNLCVDLLLRLNSEFDLVIVDLSAGRSYAMDMVLEATARYTMRAIETRWLVFHRWTRQHVNAVHGLVFDRHGILHAGADRGHDRDRLGASVRFVRTAVPDLEAVLWSQVPPAQAAWMRWCDNQLTRLATQLGVGDSRVLGTVPLEPVLQWREQLITEEDVLSLQIAGKDTLEALEELARRLTDDTYWELP